MSYYTKIFVFIVIASSLFTNLTAAQSTPEELGHRLVEAINQQNRTLLVSLFHPSTIEYYQQEENLDKKLGTLLKKSFSDQHSIMVKSMDKVEKYDSESNTLDFFGMKMTFPEPPEVQISIDETNISGNGNTASVSSKGITEMLVKTDGTWKIVRPQRQ